MILVDLLRRNALRLPSKVALIDARSGRSVSFEQLLRQTNRVANSMLALGRSGDRIGILAENIPEYVECYYGVPAAGMTLTFLNQRLHPKEWASILNDAEARVFIVQEKFLAAIQSELGSVPSVEHVVVIGGSHGELRSYEDVVGAASASPPEIDVDEHTVAWQIYTSGTTGFPKGAMLTHRNVLTAVMASVIEYAPQADERYLMAFPLCHVAGYTVPVHHFRGGTIVLAQSFEPDAWIEIVDAYAITASALAPTMLGMVLAENWSGRQQLSTLRSLLYGAAAMPVEVLRTAIERLGPIVCSGFGMTELSGNVLTFPTRGHVRAISGEEHLLASCGTPMCLADVAVVDADMNECAPGVVGEIVVRGEQVMHGYFRDEARTREVFAGGWFHTGDMARRDDEGFFYIVDRLKDMIITGGENVYSREVEEVLYTHPAIAEAAVIGLPDPTWGENVTAVVVLRSGATATEAEIIDIARRRLASFKKPKQVIFVDELPKTVSGKILKRDLRKRLGSDRV